jgi:branched-chain amino acid transport system substrate-binding protein
MRGSTRLVSAVMALALLAAACSSTSKSTATAATNSASTPGAASTTPAATAPAATTGGTVSADTSGSGRGAAMTLDTAIATALAYTGGKAGAASGDPIKIGYVNQDGGTTAFPEATIVIESAVKYLNADLGGAGGHPVQLVKCTTNSSQDSTRCAQQMLADNSISVVMTGVIAQDALVAPLLDALNGHKPVVIANPLTTPDFVATDAYAYTPGSPGVVKGLAVFAAKYLPTGPAKKVAVIYTDTTSAGQVAFTALARPTLQALGVTSVVGVPVTDTAGPAAVVRAITTAGAADADAFLPLVPVQACIGIAQALKQLGLSTPVVTTSLCLGTPMTDYIEQQHGVGVVPNNWYFGGNGYSYSIAGDPDTDAEVTMVQQYTKDQRIANIDDTGFAGSMFGNLLTVAKFINTIGVDNVSPDTIRTAAKGFTGPMWGVVGPMKCGASQNFPSVCGLEMGIQQYVDSKWVSVRDGYGNNPLNPTSEVGG